MIDPEILKSLGFDDQLIAEVNRLAIAIEPPVAPIEAIVIGAQLNLFPSSADNAIHVTVA